MESRIDLTSPAGDRLAGTLHQPATASRRGVVLGHCFSCSRHTRILVELSRSLADSGFLALRYDFSGNGQSEGDFSATTYSRYRSEMDAAVDFLRQRGADWIGLAGHSMGGVVALLTAGTGTRVQAVVSLGSRYTELNPKSLLAAIGSDGTENGVSFVSRGRRLRLSAEFFRDAGTYDLPATVAGLNVPLLIVHGDRDEIVPWSEAQNGLRLKPANTELVTIAGSDHMFSRTEHRTIAVERVTAWLERQAADAPAVPAAPSERNRN
jgi:uncharacterized protein